MKELLGWIERNPLLAVTLILSICAGLSVVLTAWRGVFR
jgi:hypothetical protein